MGRLLGSYLGGTAPFFSSRLPAYGFFLVTFACNFWVVRHGISRGIERFCKVAMPLLFVVAVVLVLRVFTLGAPVQPEWTLDRALGFLWNPDFAALARAYGGHGETVRTTEDFGPALARARESGKPAIIHCLLAPEAITPARSLSDIRNASLSNRKT